ncbi:LOW QUALITY PROTEIN: AP-4 complex accessory subunit RUSC1 isoform X1 [Gallus gallus]|uniref:LOW QUALITY PROTEIN: AP-4 complex accessory subunit RUSC1 isoform X1 n=1 Tax=Gallus gallus TaxID=9031 RepID=UPI001F01528E|nr:LOW QUALITY PROTEIN: AP-4 complex accessory subunit RUSC1 isoform X1 [Gallus gallus]
MLAPKKGLLCNLNHIHLQHISLGLHLSRHPELQDTAGSGDQKRCSSCRESCEQVDANSNSPSLKCHCCESHAELPLTLGLQNQAAPAVDLPRLQDGEEVVSPSDPPSTSSSVSSCSDFSLDESPVSVYYRGFSAEGSQSPTEPPGAVPAEDAHDGRLLPATGGERDADLNPAAPQGEQNLTGDSPDSLCSSSSLDSQYDETSPGAAVRQNADGSVDLDPNCNPLPDPAVAPAVPCCWEQSPSGAPEPRPRLSAVPPPRPTAAQRRLQLLNGHGAERPALPARPAAPEPSAELCRDAAKKNITSFHELAQKRKKIPSGPAPIPARVDRSDWLIVFSPDTELPPHNDLLPSTAGRDPTQPQQDWGVRPPGSVQREVTTFKELRYRSASNKPKAQPAAPQRPPKPPGGSDGSSWVSPAAPGGRLPAPPENHQARRRPRPALQPIAEGRPRDAELPLQSRPGERSGCERRTWRSGGSGGDPRGSGEAEHGEEAHQEAAAQETEEVRRVWGCPPPPPPPGPLRPPFSPFLSPSDPQGKALGGPRVPPVPALPSPLPSALPLPAVSGSMSELPPPGPGPGPASRRGGFALGPPQPRSLPGEAARSGPEAPALPAARPSPPAAGAPGAAQPHGDGPEGRRGALAEQKKALLIAVSTAVDKVIAHFSSARNVVQKAQLGDSWLSPDVGYLLLHTLCPALYGLVEDGLKPFQKDVITGQRRNSPWSVVEASVKTGPNTRSLHNLCWRVAGLAPLSSTRQKFHAFILGLLNTKQLEQWVSHLHNSPGVVSMLYFPTAFFALSQGPLPHLADELLLLIQPLSVLTFHLDLLFEHHHLSVDVRPLSRRMESPPSPTPRFAQGAAQPLEGQSGTAGVSLEDELPPDTLGRAPAAEESPRSPCQAAVRSPLPGPQVGAALQQTFQHVLRWGDQLSRAFLGADSSPGAVRPEAGPWDTGAGPSSWWAQLSQASRIYTAPSKERFPFIWWTKLRTAAGDSSPGQVAQTPLREPKGTELQLLQTKAIPELSSPNSSGSADTSGTSSPEDLVLLTGTPLPPAGPAAGEKPPAASPQPGAGRSQAAPPDPGPCSPGPDRGSWLGRLFGASSPSARSSPPSPDAISVRSRRPSRWLSPSSHVLAVVVKGLAAEKSRAPEQPERKLPDLPQTHRAVRALCDHTGAADGHLSFQKGDVLQLLSTVDEDWIRCCHGNRTGLVPVGYTSLIL